MDAELATLAAQIATVAALAAAPTYIMTEELKPFLFGRSQFYRPLALADGILCALLVMAAFGGYPVATFVLAGITAAGAASGTYWTAKDKMGIGKSKPASGPNVQVDGTPYVPLDGA